MNAAVPVRVVESAAITVTLAVPALVGVPEMTPLAVLMASPAGKAVADHVYGVVPPAADIATLNARFTPLY